LVTTVDEAVAAAAMLHCAVAVKVQSPEALHKREVGGVALGLVGEAAVRAAYDTVLDSVRAVVDPDSIHGVLVQEMMAPGFEMMVGRLVDDQFGPLIAVGRGGSNVELIGDVVYDLAPVDAAGALAMLRRLACWPLLEREQSSIDALAQLVAHVSRMELPIEGELTELDLNPVMVYPQAGGVAVVDAKAIVTQ